MTSLVARVVGCVALLFCMSQAYGAESKRTITDLGQGIYRFENDSHASVFIVGKKGLLMTDPINADAAKWLRAEVKKRFGDLPVRYLIYSHNHPDHIYRSDDDTV